MTPAVAIDRLLCTPPCVGTAFPMHHLACGPSNNMTPAVAIDRLLCAPPCVGTTFCVYRLACGPLNNMTPAVATGRLLCAPPCVGTAFCVYRLACGPLNNMTPAVATGRLLCAPPCVGTAFCVYRLACGPLNNMTPAVATGRLLCAPSCVGTAVPNLGMLWGGGCVRTARRFGRAAVRWRSGRPIRPADTAAEPNCRNLTGRAEPPPRVLPVHSVQPWNDASRKKLAHLAREPRVSGRRCDAGPQKLCKLWRLSTRPRTFCFHAWSTGPAVRSGRPQPGTLT